MPDPRVPKLLVGSSTEGLEVAQALKALVEPDVDLQLWNDGFFVAGEYTLDSLIERSRHFDGGLIVGTADDRVFSRDEELDSLRDNLLLEFGLFVATFGRRKAILALEGLGSTKMPTDLFGLTCVGFKRTSPVADGLQSTATEIKRVAQSFSLDVIDPDVARGLEDILRAFLADLQEAMGSAVPLGFHVWVVDERSSPPLLVRVARSRTSPKAQLAKEFQQGEGLVGECWRTATAVRVDFSEEPYKSIKEAEWKDFGPSVRRGMSHELLETSRERYRLTGATPVMSSITTGTRFLGCLSYNVGPNVDAAAPSPNYQAVEKVLDRAVEVVRIVLESQ
jgi:hypothetical protein